MTIEILSEPANPVRVRFHVNQDEAVLAGKPRWGEVTVSIDPSELSARQRLALVRLDTEGLPYRWVPQEKRRQFAECTPETVRAALDDVAAYIEQRAADQAQSEAESRARTIEDEAKREARLLEMAETLREKGVGHLIDADGNDWRYQSDRYLADAIEKRAAEFGLEQFFTETLPAAIRERQAAAAARKAEETARINARALVREAELEAWVNLHASDTQKRKHAAGLLAEKEILDGLRNMLFQPLAGFPRYEKITVNEVLEVADHDYWTSDNVKFNSSDATELTDEEFAGFEAIKTAAEEIEGASCQPRNHVGYIDDNEDEGIVSRRSVAVRLTTLGGIELSRHYAL